MSIPRKGESMSKLKVLIVSPEIHPLAKTGGLADVAGSLPLALKGLDVDVRVAMPLYKKVGVPTRYICDYAVPLGKNSIETAVAKETLLGGEVPAYLIENYRYFDRDQLYGYGDDAERFAFFSRAVLELFDRINWVPDVIHCNDWQSALIPTYLKFLYKPKGKFTRTGTVFTIHNMEYQGCFPAGDYEILGLGWELFGTENLEFFGWFNLMKAGILYSDMVNTVSESYAKEIQTPEYGAKLDGLLRANSHKLRGILNGLDYDVWNPEKDNQIENKFGVRSAGLRAKNKVTLQAELGLEQDPRAFMVGMVSRLTIQKGIDIFVPALAKMLLAGDQVVVLGTGDEHYVRMMKELEESGAGNLKILLKFDERLAHRIYAGSDVFLMPSRYEPCGLGQLISFRYGSVPIVRRTGGLADTVSDASVSEEGTGFVFNEYSSEGFVSAVERARNAYKDQARWNRIVMRGMSQDFSWRASAGKYLEAYRSVASKV